MKKIIALLLVLLLFASAGCASLKEQPQIVATTLPVYNFTQALCKDTPLTVAQLIQQEVSCLHDYTLQVNQMQLVEGAQTIVLSGAGLEAFLLPLVGNRNGCIDASAGIQTICSGHEHAHEEEHAHSHSTDPHIWLSPNNACQMVENICQGLILQYPEYEKSFTNNLSELIRELEILDQYGKEALSQLSCRELITFHDGFSYFAQSFDLTILEAIEEEAGSETSAKELIHLINLVEKKQLPAVFTEKNGSQVSAGIICAQTDAGLFTLDMAMSGNYFDAMYHNIDAVKEALK